MTTPEGRIVARDKVEVLLTRGGNKTFFFEGTAKGIGKIRFHVVHAKCENQAKARVTSELKRRFKPGHEIPIFWTDCFICEEEKTRATA